MGPTAASSTRRATGPQRLDWFRSSIPHGDLTPDDFARRHAVVLRAFYVLIPLLTIVAIVQQAPVWEALESIVVPAVFYLGARTRVTTRWSPSIAAVGLMSAAAALVHLSGGAIEAHFMYFVLLPLIGLYQDWKPFAVAVLNVLFFHAVIGTVNPSGVFSNEMGGMAHVGATTFSVLAATAVHVAFVAAQIVVIVVTWNLLEAGRRATTETLDELHTTQRQLVESMKHESVGTLAAGVAHEINTPIQFVGDNLAFLRSAFDELIDAVSDISTVDDLTTEVPLAIEQSIDGVRRVAEIVRSMRGFAHDGGGERTRTDLNQAVSDTLIVCRNEWKYSADLDTLLDPDLPHPEIFAGAIKQVVLNLVVNAAHAIADRHGADSKGHLVVRTFAVDDHIRLTVQDDGGGIPDDIADRVFDQFFTTKEVGRGTGHGLAISRRVVVEQHGGRLWFESEAGVGTTFHVDLPIEAPDAATARTSQAMSST